jgi:hypothetical protein
MLIGMALTMLDKYKTSDRFWAEAVNMACHAINCLYLHKLLKKTSYELLTSKKPSVSCFRLFGSKCYVLQKRSKSPKFDYKVYEVCLLDYDSNSHAYHIFNRDSSCVEITCDAMFDETTDSQEEQVDLDLVDDEEAPCDALQRLAISGVRPQDPNDHPQGQSPSDTTPPTQGLDQDHEKYQDEHENEHNDQVQVESHDQGGDKDDGDKDESNSRPTPPHPRLRHTVQRDRPMNNILRDIKKGVTTRSCVANFCEHYLFVSSFESFKIEDALRDPAWVVSMQEELNNSKCNEVWSLVERSK